MNIHDHLETLWRSPTVRAMDHHGELQDILRAKRDASHVPVVLESPFSGAPPEYVHACIRDSLLRGEAPIASHVLYTQALDDTVPAERTAGMSAGFAWRWLAARTVVYTDLGISHGMQDGLDHARALGQEIVRRELGGRWAR